MTQLTDFTPEEMAILNRTPTAVAMGAAYADSDGIWDLAKEMRAGLAAAREAAVAFPDNAVVQLLAASMQETDDSDADSDEADVPASTDNEPEDVVEERNPSLAGESAIELAGQSMAIMQKTATLEETVQFKHWLYAIAEQVALATKTGTFLGFGGAQVGDGERRFLTELSAAIGMPAEE